MEKYKRNKIKGFSLLEVVIALGVMGGISVGMMKIQKDMVVSQKRNETVVNSVNLIDKISLSLLNPDACKNTFDPTNFVVGAGTVSDGAELRAIRTSVQGANGTLFEVGKKYFNNTIEIKKISLHELNPLTAIQGTPIKSGLYEVAVTYVKSAKILDAENREYTKMSSPIAIKTSATDVISSCHSSVDDAVEIARRESCEDIGGLFNPSGNAGQGQCELMKNTQTPAAIAANATNQGFTESQYVNAAGDNMNGRLRIDSGGLAVAGPTDINGTTSITNGLNVNGTGLNVNNADIRLSAGSQICIGNVCTKLTSCAAGYIQTGLNPNGSPECTLAKCNNQNEYIEGYEVQNGVRRPICKKVPFSQCGANEYIKEVKNDGTAVCELIPPAAQGTCGDGEYLAGYLADGNKDCRPGIVANKKCNPGETLEGFDQNGQPICQVPIPDTGSNIEYSQEITVTKDRGGVLSALTPVGESYDMCFLTRGGGKIHRSNRVAFSTCVISKVSAGRWRLTGESEYADINCGMNCMNLCSTPIPGTWQQSSVGLCSCPNTGQGKLKRETRVGTQSVTYQCVGAKCGGTCDVDSRPPSSRSCTCYQGGGNGNRDGFGSQR